MTSIPGNEIQVRHASSIHLNDIIDFNAEMANETEGKDLDIKLLRLGVEAVLNQSDLGFYLIAEHSGRPVGQLLITQEWSDWRNAFFWWIQSVYVVPEYRRMGVYRSLHVYATVLARSQGNVCGIRLYVDKENRVAQGVYTSLGMNLARYDMYEIEFDTHR